MASAPSAVIMVPCLQITSFFDLESLDRRHGALVRRGDRLEHAHDVRDLSGFVARHRVAPEVVAEGLSLR